MNFRIAEGCEQIGYKPTEIYSLECLYILTTSNV